MDRYLYLCILRHGKVRTEEGLAEHRERMNQLIEEAQKEPEKTYTTLKPGSNSQEVLDAAHEAL